MLFRDSTSQHHSNSSTRRLHTLPPASHSPLTHTLTITLIPESVSMPRPQTSLGVPSQCQTWQATLFDLSIQTPK